MALPDFIAFTEMLSRVKQDDQSWGNLLRDICTGRISLHSTSEPLLGEQLAKPSLVHVLSKWDFYSSSHLDQAAKDYGVKSWQVTEYIEAIRESLAINESDLIVFEDSGVQQEIRGDSSPPTVEAVPQAERTNQSDSFTDYDRTSQAQDVQVATSAIKASPSNTVLGLIALVSALFVVLVSLIAGISGQKNSSSSQAPSSSDSIASPPSDRRPENQQAAPPRSSGEEVYFSGIDLPVTNSLCNKKRTFCIYNLARLVETESGEASYTFSDLANGQQVNINGTITIDNIDKSGGGREFTFAFRDDQGSTTPGWAAAGYFNLDQDKDPKKPGILTKFKTTESFGPKTPVGLENTSYLFPS